MSVPRLSALLLNATILAAGLGSATLACAQAGPAAPATPAAPAAPQAAPATPAQSANNANTIAALPQKVEGRVCSDDRRSRRSHKMYPIMKGIKRPCE